MNWGRAQQRFTLALMTLIANTVAVFCLFYVEVPDNNQRIVDIALGIFLGWGGHVLGFFFGSSEGSARKTELLSKGMGIEE